MTATHDVLVVDVEGEAATGRDAGAAFAERLLDISVT